LNRRTVLTFALMLPFGSLAADAMGQAAASIPSNNVISPAELAKLLESQSGDPPIVLQVGSHVLFEQAHIPGASYAGAAGQDAELKRLREQVSSLPHNRLIVIYCGCCPWTKCPNIEPAYQGLFGMGFTRIRVLYLKDNFGANWVAQGYPTAKGE
jgi:thiosulfate/3-mercaptopyruvate sulfurtransferase